MLIHNFYGHEMEQPPVHLCIGTDLASGKMGVNVFVSEPFGINSETPIGSQFRPLDVKYADETEYTGRSFFIFLFFFVLREKRRREKRREKRILNFFLSWFLFSCETHNNKNPTERDERVATCF